MLMLKEKELGEMERKLVKWQRHLEKRELELNDKERELKSRPLLSLIKHVAIAIITVCSMLMWLSTGTETLHKEFDRKPLTSVNKPAVA